MEAEYVAFSSDCKDLIPMVAMICSLSSSVGLSNDFIAKTPNVGALTLAVLSTMLSGIIVIGFFHTL
jgi:hypothetical protein